MTSAHRVSSKWSSRVKLWCASAARPTFVWAMSGASPSTHARVYKSHGTASPLPITFEPCVRTVLGPPYKRTKVIHHPKTGLVETYTQQRRGLTNIYLKRKVREDGVSTDPLDI